MPRGRDQAGTLWEYDGLDQNGEPINPRMVQPARAPSAIPGALAVVPPNPAMVAKNLREQQRQESADARAERSDQRAAATAAREQAKFEQEQGGLTPPGDLTKTGDEYLATLPPGMAAQVRAISEGRRAIPTSTRNKEMMTLLAAASQFDPTLDAANAATRVATRKDFTSGKAAQNVTALNTVLGHLGSLYKSATELHNRSLVPWNAIANAVESTGGDPRLNNYLVARKAVADEMERVFRGTGGNVSEIQEWKSTLSSSSSPEQFRGAVAKAVELLNSRLEALGAQYNQGLGRSDQPITLLKPHAQAVFNALQEGGSGVLPDDKKPPPVIGGAPPRTPPGGLGPPVDYSGVGGGPDTGLAAGQFRNEYDPVTSAGVNALIHRGRPLAEANAYVASQGSQAPIDPATYAAAVQYAKTHPNWNAAEATKSVPTTAWQRFSASPVAAGISGAGTAATAGSNDEIAGALSAATGGDYTQTRDAFNANKNILAEEHAPSNLIGQVIGGVTGGLGGEAALAKTAPGALALGSRVLGRFAPAAGDAAYGAAYGAGENNEDRGMGALTGALAGAGGGYAGRKVTGGLANVIAPPAGSFGPLYAQGGFPTVGQRFGQSGFAGKAINTAEQAMQSMPGLGSLVTRARDIPRDAAQLGAFNEALGEIGHKLPSDMVPGTAPHAFTSKAFGEAYDRARSGMQFVPDSQYLADHSAFNGVLNNGVLDAAQAAQVQKVISTSVGSRLPRGGGAMAGDAYKQASSDMGRAIDSWSRNPNTQPMANALSEYQAIFDSAAKRNSDPAAVNLLDAADRGWAKYARVRNAGARVGGDPGTFTMKGLQRAVQQEGGGVASGPFQRGQALMQDYSTAIQPLGDTLSNSGTGERLLTNRLMLGGQAGAGAIGYGAGAGGALAAHPGALAPFLAYAPGINRLVTRAIAPREATLPPAVADLLNLGAGKIRSRAPFVGRLAVPGALALEFGQ